MSETGGRKGVEATHAGSNGGPNRMVKGARIARAVLLLLRTLRTAIFLSAGKDSSTRSNSVFSSAASAPPAAAPPAPGAIIIMPPPPPADASTSKVSSIALTSSDASSRVMDFSLSMTSSTTALIATLECETLDELGMAGAMKPEKGADGWGHSMSAQRRRVQRRCAPAAGSVALSARRPSWC